jgi:putative ABC transport system permease protein
VHRRQRHQLREAVVLAITLYDLRYRLRQFLIAVVGAALVFAIGMLNAGLANSFHAEVQRLTSDVKADRWIVPSGSSGPLTSFSSMSSDDLARVRSTPGVTRADPMVVVINEAAHTGTRVAQCAVLGFVPGGIGDARPKTGRAASAPGEAVVDARLKVKLGQRFTIAGVAFQAVGVTSHRTVNAGIPVVSMTIADAQRIAFQGQDFASTIVTKGVPTGLPADLRSMSNASVRTDTLRPLHSAIASLTNSMEMMWVIAAVIVAALLYVSALERVRDFAVLKAIGSSNRAIFAGVALQSIVVTLLAAAVAAAVANLLKPLFPLPVSIPSWAFLILPALAVGVGILSSLVALRRAVSVDPSLAFAG